MTKKKNVFVIIGSAGTNSANEKLIENITSLTKEFFSLKIMKDLKKLPHFDPDLSLDNPPEEILEFRNNIENADGIIISTPEYIFSIPAGLKNAIEWCVSTTIFTDKPVGLITASASGLKGHQELQLIMRTVMARFTDETTLLIQGIKGKIDLQGQITDYRIKSDLIKFVEAFKELVNSRETK